MFQLVFLALLIVPIVEIYLLVKVGQVIGAPATILVVIAMALAGAALLRHQGTATLRRVQSTLASGELPAMAMLEGVVIMLSGLLLLTPGFFTDAIGLLGLIPPIRRALIRAALSRGVLMTAGAPRGHARPGPGPAHHDAPVHHKPRTLEGEWHREDD